MKKIFVIFSSIVLCACIVGNTYCTSNSSNIERTLNNTEKKAEKKTLKELSKKTKTETKAITKQVNLKAKMNKKTLDLITNLEKDANVYTKYLESVAKYSGDIGSLITTLSNDIKNVACPRDLKDFNTFNGILTILSKAEYLNTHAQSQAKIANKSFDKCLNGIKQLISVICSTSENYDERNAALDKLKNINLLTLIKKESITSSNNTTLEQAIDAEPHSSKQVESSVSDDENPSVSESPKYALLDD